VTGRRLLAAALAASACAPAALPAQTIDTVVVVNHNIFGPEGDAPGLLARVADALHVRTRAWVIRRTLFFDQGDRYDSAEVVESGRALRGLGVFRDVALDTTRVGGRFGVRVTTADGWSTRPQVNFSSSAGSVSYTLGVVEKNLLGTANAVMALYDKTPDRSQWELLLHSPGLVARRASLQAGYLDLSDGRAGFWAYGVPFYETSAPAALVTSGEAGTTRVLTFRDGVLADSLRRRVLRVALSGGVALRASDEAYTRLTMFAQLRREAFGAFGAPPGGDSLTFAAGIGLALGRSRYRVAESLDQYDRPEDVDVSRRLSLGLWVAPRAFGYAAGRAGVGPEVQAQWGAGWRSGFAWLRLAADGMLTAQGLDSGRVEAAMTVATQRLRRQTLVFHAEAGGASAVAPGTEFDLWLSEDGPRAFGAHAFTGTRRWWVVGEDRVLLADDFLGLVGVGIAPFAEWGGAWYAGERPRAGGDAGLALRLGATRSTRGEVTEIALASRFGAGFRGGRWALVVRQAVDLR
jgi:hypothetical protein